MEVKSKHKSSPKIPTASIADIVFLLLIFFMSVTVFKQYQGLKVELPAAKATKKIERKRMITHIWIDAQNNINIDDMPMKLEKVAPLMNKKMQENPATIVSVRADKHAKYGVVARLLEELKKANALRVNFATLMEGRQI
ncbi:biopolymer transporter ExbD [bacterium]|nr:MAG: biopolymer transporter ExbD [bacterium]